MSPCEGDISDSVVDGVSGGNEDDNEFAWESGSHGTYLNYSMQKLTAAENEIGIQLPARTESSPLSPRSVWRQSHALPKDLPPIATLFEALDNDAQLQSETSHKFNVWSVAASALKPTVAPRDAITPFDQVCDNFLIPHKELHCLDRNRHLTMRVLTAFIRLLTCYYYCEHPLNKHIPHHLRPNAWALDPGSIVLSEECLLQMER
ncbi:hypothetical protein K439DRAFT_332887 [Ramaria rubella]|nr:hypothetical protein K439DRAFT_332887 [Ramaria rubella]